MKGARDEELHRRVQMNRREGAGPGGLRLAGARERGETEDQPLCSSRYGGPAVPRLLLGNH